MVGVETLALCVGFAHVLTALGLAVVAIIRAVIDLGGRVSPHLAGTTTGRLCHRRRRGFRRGGCAYVGGRRRGSRRRRRIRRFGSLLVDTAMAATGPFYGVAIKRAAILANRMCRGFRGDSRGCGFSCGYGCGWRRGRRSCFDDRRSGGTGCGGDSACGCLRERCAGEHGVEGDQK